MSRNRLLIVCAVLSLVATAAAEADDGPRLRSHRAGASCFRASDVFYRKDREWARHLPGRVFLFGAHGKPGRLEEVDYASSVGRLMKRMRRAGHVFLHVCDAGLRGPDGSLSVAERVARDSGRPVVAAMGSIMGNPITGDDGARELVQIVIRTPELAVVDKAEAWRVFYPDGRSRALRADRYFRKTIPAPGGRQDRPRRR